ncbi:uncharacterized protein LOC142167219 [Nicotiana tabacum]|uniref:Uncharacterized protein LOC142167219 n=1 Tax=Nicotiana tabacum TaxID=4097 RepID=A0AC58SES0_TOBAC
MCFADDLLMFAGGDLHSIVALNQCFLKFSMASGLQENLEKSCVYFGGVKQNDRKQILQQMGYSQRESPFKYLGIPLSMKKLSLIQWQPLIAKIIAKISSWTAKKLAYVGRKLHLPRTTTITRRALVAWNKVCTPKSTGGLNLVNLHLWNKVAIAKTCWDLAHKKDKIWIKRIHTYYIKRYQLEDITIPQQASWMVRKIFEARSTLDRISITFKEGKCYIRQIYFQLLGDAPRVYWKSLIFKNEAKPKAKFIMWLRLHGKLLTADRLNNWGVQVDLLCSLCQTKHESRDHLYGSCRFTKALWNRLLVWMKRHPFSATTWEQQIQWALKSAKGRSQSAQAFKTIYAEVSYAVWIERNKRVFEGVSKEVDNIARNIAYLCNVRASPGIRSLVQSWSF